MTMFARLIPALRLRLFGPRKAASLLLAFIAAVSLTGCAGMRPQNAPTTPVPVPPGTVNAPKAADKTNDDQAFTPYDASYAEDGNGQYLAVHGSRRPRFGAAQRRSRRAGGTSGNERRQEKEHTAVKLMRPRAIKEAARLVTFQTAITWRYRQLAARTEEFSTIMDAAFNFTPLVLTQGEALIMPPLLARAGASMRIEEPGTATAAKATYEMLEPAQYIAVVPHWRTFLMMDDFPEPEKAEPRRSAPKQRRAGHLATRRTRCLDAGTERGGSALRGQRSADGAELSRSHAVSSAHGPAPSEPHQHRLFRPGNAHHGQRKQAEHRPARLSDYRAVLLHGRPVSFRKKGEKVTMTNPGWYPREPRIRWDYAGINDLLLWGTRCGMSDLCLRSALPAWMRLNGTWRMVTQRAITTMNFCPHWNA